MQSEGLIMKAISGFYYVKSAGAVYECKARGVFRKKEMKPFVGDHVLIETEGKRGVLNEILPRKNQFARPPLANLDQIFFIISSCDPLPNYFITDKLIAIAEHKEIEPIIVATKGDLSPVDPIVERYSKAGFRTVAVNNMDWTVDDISEFLYGNVSAFCGNSGVGKSTLLNNLLPFADLETGETSAKLGRGRHTTRHVELFEVEGGFVADTPGFSTVETMQYDIIEKDQIQYCFREFSDHLGQCKFTGCSHTVEKGCAVLDALARGEISPSRHESYLQMYNEAKEIKSWAINKK